MNLENQRMEREKEALYWLSRIPFLGSVTVGRMRSCTESYEEIYNIEGKTWEARGILSPDKARRMETERGKIKEALEEYHSLAQRGIRFITILDQDYPERFQGLEGRPLWLSVRGRLPDSHRPALAIIGSRSATRYGMEIAECFGRELAKEGIQIVSGLAAGIDGAGQKGALEGGGDTYGVLGCGINICYPREQ